MVINIIVIVITLLCLLIMYKLGIYLQTTANTSAIYNTVPFKKFLFSKQGNTIKAGDLIYTMSAIFSDSQFMFPEVYKHVMIVIEKDGVLCTAESTPSSIIGKNGNKLVVGNGVVYYPLENRLRYELSLLYVCQLNKKLTTEMSDALTNTVLTMRNNKYSSIVTLFKQFILDLAYNDGTYICYSFIYKLLKSINILPKESNNLSIKKLTHFITHIENVPLNDDYMYMPTKQLIYDINYDNEIY